VPGEVSASIRHLRFIDQSQARNHDMEVRRRAGPVGGDENKRGKTRRRKERGKKEKKKQSGSGNS
jgi:hypothetical protein